MASLSSNPFVSANLKHNYGNEKQFHAPLLSAKVTAVCVAVVNSYLITWLLYKINCQLNQNVICIFIE